MPTLLFLYKMPFLYKVTNARLKCFFLNLHIRFEMLTVESLRVCCVISKSETKRCVEETGRKENYPQLSTLGFCLLRGALTIFFVVVLKKIFLLHCVPLYVCRLCINYQDLRTNLLRMAALRIMLLTSM